MLGVQELAPALFLFERPEGLNSATFSRETFGTFVYRLSHKFLRF
jgi:hypothetical protein